MLKLNVYNAHRVDEALSNQAIVITDLSVAAQVAYQDRKSNSHQKAREPNAEPEPPTNTMIPRSGNNMTTRSARLMQNIQFEPEQEQPVV